MLVQLCCGLYCAVRDSFCFFLFYGSGISCTDYPAPDADSFDATSVAQLWHGPSTGSQLLRENCVQSSKGAVIPRAPTLLVYIYIYICIS